MNEDTLRQINRRIRRPCFAPFAGALIMLLALLIGSTPPLLESLVDLPVSPLLLAMLLYALAGSIAALGVLMLYRMHQHEMLVRTSIVHYDLDECARTSYADVGNACRALAEADTVWQIVRQKPDREWKRNAGTSSLIKRRRARAGLVHPPYLLTDLPVYGIMAGPSQLFFMPGELLVFRQGRYRAFAYDMLEVRALPGHYVEDGRVPADAKVVAQTWEHVRPDGEPDLAFTHNRQVPILAYGLITLTSVSGLALRLQVSNLAAARQFARLLPASGHEEPSPSPVHHLPSSQPQAGQARHSWWHRPEHRQSQSAA